MYSCVNVANVLRQQLMCKSVLQDRYFIHYRQKTNPVIYLAFQHELTGRTTFCGSTFMVSNNQYRMHSWRNNATLKHTHTYTN